MAPTSQGLDHGGILSSDWFSERLKNVMFTGYKTATTSSLTHSVLECLYFPHLFRALHISMVTRTDRAIVMG